MYANYTALEDVFLLARSLAYQQFWTQQREYFTDEIARQYLLFGNLEHDHTFRKTFRKVTGVSISDFLELSIVLCSKELTDKEAYLSESYFATIEGKYDTDTVPVFLNSISQTVLDAREWLQREYERHSRTVQGGRV